MIRTLINLLLTVLLLLLAASCLERTTSDLAATAEQPAQSWQLVGKFGGTASEIGNESDPYKKRFSEGKFLELGGLCATADEVFVCDYDISRIQVFDFEGRLKRSIGSGVPIEGTLASDERMFYEITDMDLDVERPWEDTRAALPWILDRANYFLAADVAAVEGGIWIADQARSSERPHPNRKAGLVFIGDDGTVDSELTDRSYVWPDYVDVEGPRMAMCETIGNHLLMLDRKGDSWGKRSTAGGVRFEDLMRLKRDSRNSSGYMEMYLRHTGASMEPGKFNGLGGVCLAYDKAVACDIGNARLQVFEMRSSEPFWWGKTIRILDARGPTGSLRFESCRDLDIDSEGRMFVIDPQRFEVALLDSRFERAGSFGKGELLEPWAIDLSDDERHIFISDRRHNEILHYALAD